MNPPARPSMTRTEFLELLPEYASGALDGGTRHQFEAYLSTHPEDQDLVDAERRFASSLKDFYQPDPPDTERWKELLRRLGSSRKG